MVDNQFGCEHCGRIFRTEEGLVVHEESCERSGGSSKKIFFFVLFFALIIGVLYFTFLSPQYTGYSIYEDSNRDSEEKSLVPKDTDGDGLTDEEEKKIGTNPQLYDTDGDTWSDYQEVKVKGTNPLKKNTDGDRYNDNEDPNPLNRNSALIEARVGAYQVQLNYVNIGILLLTGGLTYNAELYSTEVDVEVTNIGDDYTSYLNYDIVLLIGGEVINKESASLGRLNQGQTVTKHFSFSTTLTDIPSQLISYITSQVEPTVEIRNGVYERF